MKFSVTDLQKQKIEKMEARNNELVQELIVKIEENAKLIRIMDYLTDDHFRNYLKRKCTDDLIVDFLENDYKYKED